MKKLAKVEKLQVEELENRTAPFTGLPDVVNGHALSAGPSMRDPLPHKPIEFEAYDGATLNQPSLRDPLPREPIEFEAYDGQL